MVSSKAVVRHTFIVCVSWVAPGNQRDAAAGIAVAEGLAVDVGKSCGLILQGDVGQHYFSDGCAVHGNRRANAGVNAHRLRRIQFLDVHRAEIVEKREMDGLSGLLIEFLQIGKTQAADIQMPERSLAQSKAGHSEMESTVAGGIQEST